MRLIERDGYLASMHHAFNNTADGEGHCIFITGDAGIGKTSLVKAFLKQSDKKARVFTGACDSLYTPRPLSPLYDIANELGEDWVDSMHSVPSRAVLFTRFLEVFTKQELPVVIVFEDIHWADEATLDFIKFFSRRITRTKCLFILTYRGNEVTHQHPLKTLTSDLVPGTFIHLLLTPLSRQAVQIMASEKGYDGEGVYSMSGGNPFYVNEILASYRLGIPDNIKNAILSIYNRIEEKTKHAWQLLSVFPEGLELIRFVRIIPSLNKAVELCFEKEILLLKNGIIFFKHELYRKAIEESLSPFKRIDLNKYVLDLFLKDFEEEEEVERIVHHAKNANDNKLVVQYAPRAAKEAASVGAHVEAAKLYLTAIEYADIKDKDKLVTFYEGYAYECYLNSQTKNAIIYTHKAMQIWETKKEREQTGNCLRFLSRLWWLDGNRDNAEMYARQAIDVLKPEPDSKAKAMAYSNMSQLKMLSKDAAECSEWGNKAIQIARALPDYEILTHALNNIGSVQWKTFPLQQEGKNLLRESLDIALQHSFQEHAARAYANIISTGIALRDYADTQPVLEEGLHYCEEKDIDFYRRYILSWKAKLLLDMGNWNNAVSVSEHLLLKENQTSVVKIGAMFVLATIKVRKGDSDVLSLLEEVKRLAFSTKEYQRIMPVIIACLEYEWITGTKIISESELCFSLDLMQNTSQVFQNSEALFWLKKARKQDVNIAEVYEPYRLLRLGKAAAAGLFWQNLGCPYEQALALFEGTEDNKRMALSIMKQLGADAVYNKLKMEMRSSGIRKIPRGLRESTINNPSLLTNRELDVLLLLKNNLQNKDIAQTLFLSTRTVDHHISSILFKLDANSRAKAVAEAASLGIIK